MKKQTIFAIVGVIIVAVGCTVATGTPTTQSPVDEAGTVVTATHESVSTQVPTQAQMSGTPVSFEHVSFVIPDELAGGANPEAVPAIDEGAGAPWEVAPEYLKFTLTGYEPQGKFHEPGMYIYPADEYAKVNPHAAEQIENLKRILAGSTILKETLPRIPWFNAELLIAANIQLITFQNGRGVRTLTQYAQYYAPINNRELFYHFEGLTDDGKYYIFAILPITAPILAEDEKSEASVPAGGVPIPTDIGISNVYYISVTERLNSLSPDSFTPTLNSLDVLIQSILVTNP